MIHFNPDTDLVQDLAVTWNKKLKSIRLTSLIASIIMIACSVLCMVYPIQSVTVIEVVASVVIIAVGIVEIAAFIRFPFLLQSSGALVSGILNIIVGFMLICVPHSVSETTYAFMFAIMLMLFGIDEIALGSRFGYFGIPNSGWVIAGGIINCAAAIAFFFSPLYSTIMLNYIVAVYLCAGGIDLLIHAFALREMKVHA